MVGTTGSVVGLVKDCRVRSWGVASCDGARWGERGVVEVGVRDLGGGSSRETERVGLERGRFGGGGARGVVEVCAALAVDLVVRVGVRRGFGLFWRVGGGKRVRGVIVKDAEFLRGSGGLSEEAGGSRRVGVGRDGVCCLCGRVQSNRSRSESRSGEGAGVLLSILQ